MEKITNWIREISHKENAIGLFLKAMYYFFRSAIIQAVAMIFIPVGISIPISQNNYGVGFWFVIAISILIIVVITWINQYDKKHDQNIDWFVRTIKAMSDANSQIAIDLLKTTRCISNGNSNSLELSTLKELSGLQKISFFVCTQVYNIIMNTNKTVKGFSPYVTIYSKFPSSKGDICRMIAYHSNMPGEPASYNVEYDIKTDRCYHTKIFREGRTDIRVLPDADAVKEAFSLHSENDLREHSIQQYIGIPINMHRQGITLLLQIDVNVAGILGSDKGTVEELARNVILPHGEILKNAYENERFLETVFDKWYKGGKP